MKDLTKLIDDIYIILVTYYDNNFTNEILWYFKEVFHHVLNKDITSIQNKIEKKQMFSDLPEETKNKYRFILKIIHSEVRKPNELDTDINIDDIKRASILYYENKSEEEIPSLKEVQIKYLYKQIFIDKSSVKYSALFKECQTNEKLRLIDTKFEHILNQIHDINIDDYDDLEEFLEDIRELFDITKREKETIGNRYFALLISNKVLYNYFVIEKLFEMLSFKFRIKGINNNVDLAKEIFDKNKIAFETYANFPGVKAREIMYYFDIPQEMFSLVSMNMKYIDASLDEKIQTKKNYKSLSKSIRSAGKYSVRNDATPEKLYKILPNKLKENYPLSLYNQCISLEYNPYRDVIVRFLDENFQIKNK